MKCLILAAAALFFAGSAHATTFQLTKIDLIVVNEAPMVQFYDAVFGITMQPKQVGTFTFYDGFLPNGIELNFAPETFVGVHIEQNRHQLNFAVDHLDDVIALCLKNGGTQQGDISTHDGIRTVSVTDPDGNFMVFLGP